jgi:hypothetical protein
LSSEYLINASWAKKALTVLITVEVLLVYLYWTTSLTAESFPLLHNLFNLDGEANIPAWFSSIQIFIASLICWRIAGQTGNAEKPSPLFWRTIGSFLFLLSLDEVVQLHERITAYFGSRYIEWMPNYLASHPLLCLFLILSFGLVARFFYVHFRALCSWSSRLSLLALAGVCLSLTGGCVLESLGFLIIKSGLTFSLYRLEVSAEELFEMLGISIFLYVSFLFSLEKQHLKEAVDVQLKSSGSNKLIKEPLV